MTKVDVTLIIDLFKQVGVKLMEFAEQGEPPADSEALFSRFQEANNGAIATIKQALTKAYPHIPWADIEFDEGKQKSHLHEGEFWVCDPIDGAFHFLQGLPLWASSLCLIRHGQPVFALVYDHGRQECFYACVGEGVFLNGKRVKVGGKKDLEVAVLTTIHPSIPARAQELTAESNRVLAQVMPKALAVRMLGAVSLQIAYVACGRVDGYWELGSDMTDWAAGALLVREAGGEVTDGHGEAFTWGCSGIIATNSPLHAQLKEAICTK